MATEESPRPFYQTINLLGGSSQNCQDRIGIDVLPSLAKLSGKPSRTAYRFSQITFGGGIKGRSPLGRC